MPGRRQKIPYAWREYHPPRRTREPVGNRSSPRGVRGRCAPILQPVPVRRRSHRGRRGRGERPDPRQPAGRGRRLGRDLDRLGARSWRSPPPSMPGPRSASTGSDVRLRPLALTDHADVDRRTSPPRWRVPIIVAAAVLVVAIARLRDVRPTRTLGPQRPPSRPGAVPIRRSVCHGSRPIERHPGRSERVLPENTRWPGPPRRTGPSGT